MDDIEREFWEELEDVIQSVPQSEKIFLGGDFNVYIGSKADGYDMKHVGFGYRERNSEGVSNSELYGCI